MLKVSFATLWKIAVLLLLAVIAFYSYRINSDLGGTYYAPGNIGGCGGYTTSAPVMRPMLCVQPATNSTKQ